MARLTNLLRCLLAVGVLVLVSGNRVVHRNSATTVFHYATAFSGTQGTNAVRYGYYAVATNPATYQETGMTYDGAGTWNGTEAFSTPILTALFWHPGISITSAAVARWTCTTTNASASFKIDAQLASSAGNIKLLIYINGSLAGVELDVSGDTSAHTTTVSGISITSGDTVDLVLDPNSSASSDGTNVDLTITIP